MESVPRESQSAGLGRLFPHDPSLLTRDGRCDCVRTAKIWAPVLPEELAYVRSLETRLDYVVDWHR